MNMNRISTIIILSVLALCGCNHKNESSYNNTDSSTDLILQNDADDIKDDDTEAYYCDKVNDCISKYPELNTTDVVIDNDGFGPMIVSPYASDDVVRAVAHVIYDTNIEAYCFGNYLFDKYSDNFTKRDYDEVYKIIQSRVAEAREQADLVNKKLIASIENDSEINISSDGEYYYILDMDNFDESASAIQASIDRQSDVFDFDMQFYSEYYFSHDGRMFTGGYRGPTYAIYLDNYLADNKIYEYYYWKAKNEWVNVYTDLYISQIYDYTKISEKLDTAQDYWKQLSCSSTLYQNKIDTGLYAISYSYRMSADDFDLSEVTELAYEVYTNVCSANARHSTDKICGMYIDINNFTEYGMEYSQVYVFVPFDEEYSLEEFTHVIENNIEIRVDSEPE